MSPLDDEVRLSHCFKGTGGAQPCMCEPEIDPLVVAQTDGKFGAGGVSVLSTVGVDIVARGWDLPGWERDFYPEGLPFDWRLAYFANELPAVMIEAERWMAADEAEMRAWYDDVPEGFRFYLQDPETAAGPSRWELARRALGAKLAGPVSEEGAQQPLPAAHFQILSGADAAPEEGCLPAWRIPPTVVRDLRAGRAWLESLQLQPTGGRGLLVLPGDDIGVEDLKRWWQLLWLIGLA